MSVWTNIENTPRMPGDGTAAPAAAMTDQTNPVEWLKTDHQLIRRYLDDINSSAADRLGSLEALKQLLALHNAIEENLVYPTIARVAGRRDQAFELFHQTAEADILLYTVQRAQLNGDAATYSTSAAELRDAVIQHAQFEETQIFPMLESAPPAELQALAQQILQFRQTMVRDR